ncbi:MULTISPECIES: hypothetical protein [Niastella]|uniref:ATP-binding protein n=1 Tax=Niastella soli TaxID=2821487 RepID=A0ABS3Z3B4_9BACT|nr:hypothetical protein [Niastella soli]MBO9204624.1 hypothetical protein [Niastella soli]
MDNILRYFLSSIAKPDRGVLGTIYHLKNNADYQDLCTLIDSTSHAVQRQITHFIGNPFPKSYAELGSVPAIIESSSTDAELDWLFLALRHGHSQIRSFLKLKIEFEKFILNAKYEEAENTLTQIETEICVSLWSLENRLLLSNLKNGLAGNKHLLEIFLDQIEDIKVKCLSIYLSERVEIGSTVCSYEQKILAAFNNYKQPDRDAVISYFLFKLVPYKTENINVKFILEQEFKFSLVDRYLTLVKLCSLAATNLIDLNLDKYVYKLRNLYQKTEDHVLQNVVCKLKGEWEPSIVPYNDKILVAYRLYLEGNYKDCYHLSKTILNNEVIDFKLLVIHIKCSIYLKIDEYDIGSTVILERILKSIRYILTKERIDIFSQILIKFAYVLESHTIGVKLYDYFMMEIANDEKHSKLSRISDHSHNPTHYQLYRPAQQAACLIKQIEHIHNNFSHSYFYYTITHNTAENIELLLNNDIRKRFILIDSSIAANNYGKSISDLKSILPDLIDVGFAYEKAIRRLFNCYITIKNFNGAIDLFVDSHFHSNALTTKFDSNNLIKLNKKNRFRNLHPSITVPIFYFINEAEEVDISNTLKLFLRSFGVSKPSELKPGRLTSPKKYIEFFFYNVCTVEILKHSSIYETPKEIIIERINVLNNLAEWNSTQKEHYNNEVQENTKKLIILDGINKLNESKIYINEDGLYETEIKFEEPAYERIISLIKVHKDNSDIAHDKPVPLYMHEALKELFLAIRHGYLFSKYGLVNYLSTRIRHGILEAALRPIYQKLKLITEKGTTGDKYIPNTHWDNDLLSSNVSKDKIDRFHIELSSFSKEFDRYILEDLLSKKLQIKTESKNNYGLFDFTYTDEEIAKIDIYKKTQQDFKQFIQAIFNELGNRTDQNLEIIREYLTTVVASNLSKHLADLEEAVQKIIKKDSLHDFFNNINICRDHIRKELEKISHWFVRSDSQMSDFTLSDILDINNEYLSKCILTKKLQLDKKLSPNIKVKGKYYVHFSDLFRLFMGNALAYSNLPGAEVPLRISTKLENDPWLEINIYNPLDKDADLNYINHSLNKLKLKHHDLELLTSEGNSGLMKARNILISDLNNPANEIDYFVNSDNEFQVTLTINITDIKHEDSFN